MNHNRILSWPDCYNVRDLGGHPTATGAETRWQALIRADELTRLLPAGYEALRAYGVRTVIDLRSPGEVARAVHPCSVPEAIEHGLTYHAMSLIDPDEYANDRWLAGRPPGVQESYEVMLERFAARIGAIPDPERRAWMAEQQTSAPEIMRNTLNWIERRFGDVPNYLHMAGLTDDELEHLAARLLQ